MLAMRPRERGGRVDNSGSTTSPIFGPTLDGHLPGNEVVSTAGGGYTRAVGPMQFLPETWKSWAADGNVDGIADPNNVFDASLAAGKYLCSGGLDLRDAAQELQAVLRYNHSLSYAADVLGWSLAYRSGRPLTAVDVSGSLSDMGDLSRTSVDAISVDDPTTAESTDTATSSQTTTTTKSLVLPTSTAAPLPTRPPVVPTPVSTRVPTTKVEPIASTTPEPVATTPATSEPPAPETTTNEPTTYEPTFEPTTVAPPQVTAVPTVEATVPLPQPTYTPQVPVPSLNTGGAATVPAPVQVKPLVPVIPSAPVPQAGMPAQAPAT